jgi:hypothetical protein
MYRIHVERGLIKREYGMAAREVRPSGEIVEVKIQVQGSEKDDYWVQAKVIDTLSVMFTATIPETTHTRFYFYSDIGDTWRNIA